MAIEAHDDFGVAVVERDCVDLDENLVLFRCGLCCSRQDEVVQAVLGRRPLPHIVCWHGVCGRMRPDMEEREIRLTL